MKHRITPETIARSRHLRREMTGAERNLWRMLREHFNKWHFRRQVPIGRYLADFASHRAKLVIDVDGGQHSIERDSVRTAAIEQDGYRIVRSWNHEALANFDGVFSAIQTALHTHPTPSPSPSRGGVK